MSIALPQGGAVSLFGMVMAFAVLEEKSGETANVGTRFRRNTGMEALTQPARH